MNNLNIIIVDYGLGNLKSVSRAFDILGNPAEITSDIEKIKKADCVILPGVGAFGDGMEELKKRGLIGPIKEFAKSKKPMLGICLGMQLFMTKSEEFGLHKGLNLIQGRVIEFKSPDKVNIEEYKVPNFGWCELTYSEGKSTKDWKDTILENIKQNSEVYFIHSFYVKPKNKKDSLAIINYGNQKVCAVIKKQNIVGCQFHPEKSGNIGLKMLKSFIKLVKQGEGNEKE